MNATGQMSPPAEQAVPRPPRRWPRLAMLTLIFVCGAIAGASLTLALQPPRRTGRPTMEQTRDRVTASFAARLNLTDNQTKQVSAIVEQRLKAWKALRKELLPREEAQAAILHTQIAAVLTDTQKPAWDKLYAERFHRWFPEAPATQPASAPTMP